MMEIVTKPLENEINSVKTGDVFIAEYAGGGQPCYFLALDSGWVANLKTGQRTTIGDVRAIAKNVRIASKATLTIDV